MDRDSRDRSRLIQALIASAMVVVVVGATVAVANGTSIRRLASAFKAGSATNLTSALKAAPSTGVATSTSARRRAPLHVAAGRHLNAHRRHGHSPTSFPAPGVAGPPEPARPVMVPGRPNPSSPPVTPPTSPSSPADTTPPQTSITADPATGTAATTASFSFTSSESGSTFECRLDGGAWVGCGSPKSYSSLAVGEHHFSVRASDRAGNVDGTPATYDWTVAAPSTPATEDTVPPQTSIISKPPETTAATTAKFSFAANESSATFDCKLDDGSWVECTSPKSYSSVEEGEHEFRVRAVDEAENIDRSPAVYEWTVETETETPPPTEPPPTEPPPPPPPPTEPPPPTPPAADCTATVSSTSAVQSTLSAAAPGVVICLAGGSYGQLSLDATKAAPGVTVRAASPGATTIAGASLQGSNLTLARFVSTDSIQVEPGATAMTIEHNRVTGGGQGIDAGPTSTTTINDTKVIGNQLIGPFGEDAIHLNRYHDSDGDGIGILIEGNEITGVRENGNHSDCLQTVWVGDHISFRKNYLHDNRCQGFFVKDQDSLGGVSAPIDGISVEDNLFLRNKEPCAASAPDCGQPIYFHVFGPYSGLTVKRNTIWGDGADSIAAFREGTGSDTQITDNVIYRLWTDTNMSPATVSNNTVCQLETGAGGSWPSSRAGETTACGLGFQNTAADDYRLNGDRGVDWAPAEQHFGP